MYCNSVSPRCKLEIGFNNIDELNDFLNALNVVNAISKTDYSFLIQQVQWLITDFKRLANLVKSDDGYDDDIPFA